MREYLLNLNYSYQNDKRAPRKPWFSPGQDGRAHEIPGTWGWQALRTKISEVNFFDQAERPAGS
jgi:hypothetical protein